MDGRRTPGGVEEGNAPVRHITHPFSQQGIRLNGREGAVGSAPLLGSEEAARTQVEPTGREGGAEPETSLARQLTLF